jgi:hypothetical protein
MEAGLEVALEVALLAHGEDNSATGGPAFKALFPNGLDAELRPIGPSQVAAAFYWHRSGRPTTRDYSPSGS